MFSRGMNKIVEKGWGQELWIHNEDEYCGKILTFNKNAKFSMHYHLLKHETWYIVKGIFKFTIIDTRTAERVTTLLKEGDLISVPQNTPHQLETETGGEIFEVSTTHYDYDSYRVEKGDSQ